ncbi:hypothetical protein [Flavobacterium sp. W21_SRS_FM6]|uniref:hypothetical protein n=1 Tax=Flavobacterium sp. W21_SRS_FM6 TaxID=3240268 RepID=UPI003F8E2E86
MNLTYAGHCSLQVAESLIRQNFDMTSFKDESRPCLHRAHEPNDASLSKLAMQVTGVALNTVPSSKC